MTPPQAVLARRLRTQARACAELGSPLYAELMGRAAADVEARGPVFDVLAGHENDPGEDAIALRLFAGLHRFALEGGAPAMAAHLPTTGGDADADAAWPAVLDAVRDAAPRLRAGLNSPPQTNEVGRSAALLVGFHTVASETTLPLRLLEVGTSAGLNLTRATLDAATKYPWPRAEEPSAAGKFGVYDDDRLVFDWFRDGRAPGSAERPAHRALPVRIGHPRGGSGRPSR